MTFGLAAMAALLLLAPPGHDNPRMGEAIEIYRR
jgi:hypothetical protein